jgi:hypothetical protein
MGKDDKASEELRADYIFKNLREEWIEFNTWRWEVFFKKLCTRLHAIGKEVLALAMYCTDPFESEYCLGIDLRKIVEAGVDYITANILPTSCYIGGRDDRQNFFEKYMALAPTTAAYLPKGHLISMLGLQDATEEWSAMHHAPSMHERDIYTMMAYQTVDESGISRALDGYYLCLGDGIKREDWNWERVRLEGALSTGAAAEITSPSMLWSDTVHRKMLHEYIHTRRWTPFKHFFEFAKAGVHLAATVRPEGLKCHTGALVVPNIDMLSAEEAELVKNYKGGAVLATAPQGFDPKALGIDAQIIFSDSFSDYPLMAFAFNCTVSDSIRDEISRLISVDDGTKNLEGDIVNIPESPNVLSETLTYAKVNTGFRDAMAKLLDSISGTPFEIDKPSIILKLKSGAYRIYLFNDSSVKYHRAFVRADRNIIKTETVTEFPILPPRFMEAAGGNLHHIYKDGEAPKGKSFEIKIQPAGVTVIDVYLED